MPKTITKECKVYSFGELSDDVKEKVIEKHRQYAYEDSYHSESLKEYFKEYLEERGLPSEEIEFSLSYCQGDGVAFYGRIVNWRRDDSSLEKFLKHYNAYDKFKDLAKYAYIRIEIARNRNGYHYSHYNTMCVDVEWESSLQDYDDELRQAVVDKIEEPFEDLAKELREVVEEIVVEVSKELEKQGYAYFDDVYSDERITEEIKINEYRFTEDGTII